MLAGKLQILSMDDTPSGAQGAKILTLRSQAGSPVVFRVRWRAQSSSGLINEPRKELAAYAVQKLFLGDDAPVAPPTAPYCFPLEEYRSFAPEEASSFAKAHCVLGFASYWLEGVKTVEAAREDDWLDDGDGILDDELFAKDALYRDSIANANLLTYLIDHGDAHLKQFMVERTQRGLRAYIVDSSIAFLSIKNPMLLVREDWSAIQVPTLSRQAIARLRVLKEEQLAQLNTVSVLELRDRQLVNVDARPGSIAFHDSEMSWQGDRLRIGLTKAEIDLVSKRLRKLLAQPDLDTRLH
jgi:hypothetical protein